MNYTSHWTQHRIIHHLGLSPRSLFIPLLAFISRDRRQSRRFRLARGSRRHNHIHESPPLVAPSRLRSSGQLVHRSTVRLVRRLVRRYGHCPTSINIAMPLLESGREYMSLATGLLLGLLMRGKGWISSPPWSPWSPSFPLSPGVRSKRKKKKVHTYK